MSTSAVPARSGSSLTERYVYAVTRRLPEDQRTDVGEELRETIAGRIATLAADRPDRDSTANERLALQEIGDPDRVAAGYTGQRLHLIGPELYPAWKRLLTLLLSVVVPSVTIVVAIIDILTGARFGEILGGALSLLINLSIQITFWVTLTFAIVERTVEGADRLPSSFGIRWDVDQLPDLPKQRGSLSDLIAGLVWLGLIGLAIVWQQVQPPIADGLPLLAPDLWKFWLPLILLLLVAEAAFEIIKYRMGRWTIALATINVVLGALFAAPVVYLAATDRLLNPSAVADIQNRWAGFDAGIANTVIVIVSLAMWVGDGVDGWWRTIRAGRITGRHEH